MIRYRNWAPSQFDEKGLNLPDQQDWWVAPVTKTGDSECQAESNFDAVLKILEYEKECDSETPRVEIHRFGHWACGWLEIILCHPDLEDQLQDIEDRLSNYPVLDEEDYSRREEEEYNSSWKEYACRDFVRTLCDVHDLSSAVKDFMMDADEDVVREFYEEISPERYYHDSGGIVIDTHRAAVHSDRGQLTAFLVKLWRLRCLGPNAKD